MVYHVKVCIAAPRSQPLIDLFKEFIDFQWGRVCQSIEFEFIWTIILNHGTGFLGPNQTNKG